MGEEKRENGRCQKGNHRGSLIKRQKRDSANPAKRGEKRKSNSKRGEKEIDRPAKDPGWRGKEEGSFLAEGNKNEKKKERGPVLPRARQRKSASNPARKKGRTETKKGEVLPVQEKKK